MAKAQRVVQFGAPVECVRFSPNGDLLASAGWRPEVKLWDPVSGSLLGKLLHGSMTFRVVFLPDGGRIATYGLDGAVRLWDRSTGEPTTGFRVSEGLSIDAFFPDGSTF